MTQLTLRSDDVRSAPAPVVVTQAEPVTRAASRRLPSPAMATTAVGLGLCVVLYGALTWLAVLGVLALT